MGGGATGRRQGNIRTRIAQSGISAALSRLSQPEFGQGQLEGRATHGPILMRGVGSIASGDVKAKQSA
jgi:hypothetical protein